jgi:hypothetical protein
MDDVYTPRGSSGQPLRFGPSEDYMLVGAVGVGNVGVEQNKGAELEPDGSGAGFQWAHCASGYRLSRRLPDRPAVAAAKSPG